MKIKLKSVIASCMTLALVALCFTGCATQPQAAPNNVESFIYSTQTNVVFVTNSITVTNTVVSTLTVTNSQNQIIPVFQTNTVLQTIPQIVTQTNYVFSSSPATTASIQSVGAVVNTFAPGIGSVISAALIGLIGLWGGIRNNQAKTSGAIAANTVQGLEVARQIIASLPNGATYLQQFDNWLMIHQQDANVANEIASIVDSFTKGTQWDGIATGIVNTVKTPTA